MSTSIKKPLPSPTELLTQPWSKKKTAQASPVRLHAHFSEGEAAAILGVSISFLRSDRYRERPRIPYLKVGARVTYSVEQLQRFIKENTTQ